MFGQQKIRRQRQNIQYQFFNQLVLQLQIFKTCQIYYHSQKSLTAIIFLLKLLFHFFLHLMQLSNFSNSILFLQPITSSVQTNKQKKEFILNIISTLAVVSQLAIQLIYILQSNKKHSINFTQQSININPIIKTQNIMIMTTKKKINLSSIKRVYNLEIFQNRRKIGVKITKIYLMYFKITTILVTSIIILAFTATTIQTYNQFLKIKQMINLQKNKLLQTRKI
ncbi:transmembrane protein, putative (macronuclear) [Tetrahymena thermophila SB210]|uniref:Transmembrane protein, putative n=1 Tax=Tetrahymena thermophila (strain SB210) TaxID=312017 RepID=W7XH53_TETTS|nr:transmembrane protein, putative [Tetrahymena thermophila SB210]EWS72339.1 transmembrane protein, putative [Tetrahymena thermophila SB210]|eukprot:XP_012655116.1 transmembrane protein, putative [Tetrahymena thermophila SB210]